MSKNKKFSRTENNMLLAIIGDEETVTGFLLAGIGERNENSTNFLIVNSTTEKAQIIPSKNHPYSIEKDSVMQRALRQLYGQNIPDELK